MSSSVFIPLAREVLKSCFPTVYSSQNARNSFMFKRQGLQLQRDSVMISYFSQHAFSHQKKQTMLLITASATFPNDYNELLCQVKDSTQQALNDGKKLMEIEFPTAGLESVAGDAEGGIEMTKSMILVRDFCLELLSNEQYTRTRIFFPDISEMTSARSGVFEGTLFKLDYLTNPSVLEDFGFGRKVKMTERVKQTDELLVVAYPYFNVNEMLAVEELYIVAEKSGLPIVVFNGDLDRIRSSGYYPSFFYPKTAALAKNFLPKFETVYYIHNFKGRYGGTLFRAYPSPWQVLRRTTSGSYVSLLKQDTMPSLKEVALDILPRA